MMANRHDHADEGNEQKRRALERLVENVEDCLGQASALTSVLGELERSRLRGAPVQDELNTVFDECEALVSVARFAQSGTLEPALEDAVDYGLLEPAEHERFESFWSDVGWIAPGVQAYVTDRDGAPKHWTDKDISFETVHGELVIEHTIEYGVDTVHRIQVPPETLFADSVQRLQVVAQVLPAAIEKDDVDRDAIEQILETRSDLADVLEQLAELAPDGSESNAAAEAEATSEEGDALDKLFEETDQDDEADVEPASLGIH